jgi:hemoglobin-like flavoprotein
MLSAPGGDGGYRNQGRCMSAGMFRPEIELFNDSLARCLRGGQFFQRFYDQFLASSPEVREKFRTTDFRKQRRMLQTSFYMLVEYIALGWPECEAYLERIAAAHGKQGRDIPPHLYDLWVECLLRAVKECDDQYSSAIEAAWRYMMGAGVSFIKARYDGPVASREVSG